MGQSMTTKLLLAPLPQGFLDLPTGLLCKISRISRVEAHTEPICLTYFLLTKKISKCFKMYWLQFLIFRLHAAAGSLITVYFFSSSCCSCETIDFSQSSHQAVVRQLTESFYIKYGSSIITSKVSQKISVMKT